MDWIQTYTGRKFFPLAPRVEDLDILDIAHALALKCRFAGHCLTFYSVAQHSVLVSESVPLRDSLWGLMHDAAEAYLPDVARPVKKSLVGFAEVEARLMECVAEWLGLPWPMPESVKRVDTILLRTEMRDLMEDPPEPWTSLTGISPLDGGIEAWDWRDSEKRFLGRFEKITGRNRDAACI